MRARIARAVLGEQVTSHRVGGFTLRPAQREGLAMLRAAIAAFGGALLADRPGTGKTVLALAVAAEYPRVLVAAPAALRAQWLRSAARAGRRLEFVSLESLSRSRPPPLADLVIVDEAHHLRNPATARYRTLAAASVGTRLLLLSATPVVNRRADRDALLALFLGARAATLSRDELARVVVRRSAEPGLRPGVIRLPDLEGAANVDGLGAALTALPPSLPLAAGDGAAALVRMSLALAWCSSLAALDEALRRRLRRGESLRETLRCGRWPSRASLRAWARGDDATQLAFVDLLDPTGPASRDLAAALGTIEAHLDSVRSIRARIEPHIGRDVDSRAAAIRALHVAHPGERIVVFARHRDTIRALFRALRPLGGVVAIHGERVEAAAGRWRRDEVLALLGESAGPVRADDARVVRVLLSTDLLAEGVELPAMGTIVHADLPWTPARLEQRRGRVTRGHGGNPGGAPRIVREARFTLPPDAVPFVRLLERLRRKDRRRRRAVRDAESLDALRRMMDAWRVDDVPGGSRCQIAAVASARAGFLALLRVRGDGPADGTTLLLCSGSRHDGRWRVSTRRTEAAEVTCAAMGPAVAVHAEVVREIRRALAVMCGRAAARLCSAAGAAPGARGVGRGAALPARLATRLSTIIAHARYVDRAPIARLDAAVRSALQRGVGAGTERALVAALHSTHTDAECVAGIRRALRAHGAAAGRERPLPTLRPTPGARAPALLALLVLSPTRTPRGGAQPPAPTSAGP